MSTTDAHLSSFTAIIGLLAVKHPDSRSEFALLRQAVVQWYDQVAETLRSKNREILSAKTRGTGEVKMILREVQHYMDCMGQHYQDPILKNFREKFAKAQEEFDFSDLDLRKFQATLAKEVQTDPVEQFLPGFDLPKLIELLEDREALNRQLAHRVSQLEQENQRLHEEIMSLRDEREAEEREYAEKLEKLRGLLEGSRMQPGSPEQAQPTYRSYPEIANLHSGAKLSMRVMEVFEQHQSDEEQSGKWEDNFSKEMGLRALMSQALALEAILTKIHF